MKLVRIVLLLVGLSAGTAAYAVTGNFQISAGGGNNRGYCKSGECTPAYGAIANPLLSDGKEARVFVDAVFSFCPAACSWTLIFTVGGFSSNPGSSYITGISVNTGCDSAPNTYNPALATYFYNAATGKASWVFPARSACMHPGGFYDVSVF